MLAALNADVLNELLALRGYGEVGCLTMPEKRRRDDIVHTRQAVGR